MSYHKQLYPDKRTSNSGNLARYNDQLNSYVSGRIQSAQTEFFEYEEFEVTEVSDTIYGGVLGVFTGDINGVNREIKGDVVLPLYPNIIQIPLVGERIEVVEYSGQHYYSGVINRTNKPNENAIANYSEGSKYGETFERKDVKHIKINEGDIVFNGRFNSGIVLGSDDNKAVTKIVVGHRNITDNLYSQNIDSDDSSIYLLSDGTSTRLDGQRIEELGSANLFICKDGVLKTPKLSGSILDGVTRNSVIRIANDVLGIKVEETDIHLDELLEADEVFCTGTAVVVAPVGKVTYQDKVHHFSGGSIGPIANKCKETLTSIQREEITDSFGWVLKIK